MIKKIAFFSVALILIASCNKTEKVKNALTEINLNGKVKSVKVFKYNVEEKFGEFTKTDGKLKSITLYNEFGNASEWTTYTSTGEIQQKKIYKYDSKNRKKEVNTYNNLSELVTKSSNPKFDNFDNIIEFTSYNKDGNLKQLLKRKYDDNSNLVEENYYDSLRNFKGRVINKYDSKGNILEAVEYDSLSKVRNKWVKKYDKNDNCLIDTRYNSKGILEGKHKFKYDSKNNILEDNWKQLDGKKPTGTRYRENEDGSLTPFEVTYFNQTLDKKWTFKYKYDKNKNWIEKVEILDGIPQGLFEREIEYYK